MNATPHYDPPPTATPAPDIGTITHRLAPLGLRILGALHCPPSSGILGEIRTLVLIGNAGGTFWPVFTAWCAENGETAITTPRDKAPLDRWTRHVLSPLAEAFDAKIFFPFEGPPYHPFQSWAVAARCAGPSPIGTLVHPRFGPWHAYRGALGFSRELDILTPQDGPTPCTSCPERPCLTACPTEAFAGGTYDTTSCVAHLKTAAGRDCIENGCHARHACPHGQEYRYPPEQARFHMLAFLRAMGVSLP